MTWKLSENSLKNREGVHNDLIEVCDLALRISPVDFGIPRFGGIRTEQEQNDLFLSGKSKCDGLIKIGKHQTGEALDFYAFVDGKATWKLGPMMLVGASFLQASSILRVKLRWGGLWKNFKDYPHVELG